MDRNASEDKGTKPSSPPHTEQRQAFEEAAQGGRSSFMGDFWHFLSHNKKFWMLPMILFLLLLGALMILGGTPIGPFIYPLF